MCALEKERTISDTNFRVNEIIRAPEVRLIGPNGENIGVVSIREALKIANDAELDLVEVAPNSTPPVCRVMDFGKFLFEKTKKEREARKAQTKIEIKEIRLRPKTNQHHRGFKTQDARGWLLSGMKVRVTIRFRGREIDYPELALEDLKEISAALADVATIEQAPIMEGRVMTMLLTPMKLGKKRSTDGEKPEAEPAPAEAAPAPKKTGARDANPPEVEAAPAAKKVVSKVAESEKVEAPPTAKKAESKATRTVKPEVVQAPPIENAKPGKAGKEDTSPAPKTGAKAQKAA